MRTCQPIAIALLCSVMLQSLVGCARWDCNSRRESWETELRTMAGVAYRTHFGEAGSAHAGSDDYREGWMEGYYQVLSGRTGQPPLVPASQYWEPASRHANNLGRVADWRRGFTDGAAAALDCGQQGYATVPASAPMPPLQQTQPIYTVDCFTNLAPDGMLNAPARELPPMPMPLPPTLQHDDDDPMNTGPLPPQMQRSESDDLLPSPSDLPAGADLPDATTEPHQDDESLLLGAAQPTMDEAFARLRMASRSMRQSATVVRLPRVTDAQQTGSLR